MTKFSKSHKKLYLNFGGLSNRVQGKEFSPYGFGMCNNIHQLVSSLAQFAATKPYRKFYFVNPDYIFGHDLANGFKEQLKNHLPDAKIVGEDYHPMGTKDFAPYVTKIIASGADAIFTGSFATDLYLFSRTVRKMGLKAPFPFFTTAGTDPELGKQLQDEAEGVFTSFMYDTVIDTPENKKLVTKWHEKFKNKRYDWWYPMGIHAWELLGWPMFFAAVEKAGSLDSEKIIEAFEGFWYKTQMGWTSMRKCDHQIIPPMFVLEIKKGPNSIYPWPYVQDYTEISAMKAAIPPTPDYNPRCP